MKKLIFVMAVSFVGIANATVWNPAANWIFPPDAGDWGNTANWTDGVPMADSDAAFVVPGAADCHVTTPDAVCGVLLQGDNGPGGVLRIMDGGSLTTGSNWSAVGYNDTAQLIVEAGGTVNFDDHLYVALNHGAVGTLDLEGGTVNVGGMFGLGWNGGDGNANINDGTLNISYLPFDSIQGSSHMDIESGTVVIDGNVLPQIMTLIFPPVGLAGITAYDGTGTVYYNYDIVNPGKTTIWGLPSTPTQGNGDVDGDGNVNATDLSLFAAEWLQIPPDPNADFTGDGMVNFADFEILAANWVNGP